MWPFEKRNKTIYQERNSRKYGGEVPPTLKICHFAGQKRQYNQGRCYRGRVGCGTPLASEAVGKLLKYRLLSANVGLSVVTKTHQNSCLFCREYHDFDSYWYFTTWNIQYIHSNKKRCQQGVLKLGL